ncbi:hypothetical protein HanPI659440_Chr15g0596071 [Helianthus annuus]|nr:hypothetical protein HanPI659440_Chr15g0596071 [Helianthus annuus]
MDPIFLSLTRPKIFFIILGDDPGLSDRLILAPVLNNSTSYPPSGTIKIYCLNPIILYTFVMLVVIKFSI